MPLLPLTTADLTQATLDGAGVFDTLMRANKAHLEAEFSKNRIKGPEYATVYLGSLESVLRASVEFLLQKDKLSLEAQLLEQQIILAQVGVEKAQAELLLLQQSLLKIPAEIALLTQQTSNLAAEALNIPKQGAVLDAEKCKLDAEIALLTQQTTNLAAEALNIPKQGLLLDSQKNKIVQEIINLASQKLQIDSQTALSNQQKVNLVAEALNIPKQGAVLDAEKCKLDAEFDLIKSNTLKSAAEIALLTQKTATEKAQTTAIGVDPDSVIGKQKSLYAAQTAGFTRDAEQKATKLMVDSWAVRRTTDEGELANDVNKLENMYIGRAVDKLLAGIGA